MVAEDELDEKSPRPRNFVARVRQRKEVEDKKSKEQRINEFIVADWYGKTKLIAAENTVLASYLFDNFYRATVYRPDGSYLNSHFVTFYGPKKIFLGKVNQPLDDILEDNHEDGV